MRFLILLIPTCMLLGCDDDNGVVGNACAAENPIEDVEWLQELKNSLTNCTCEQSIIQGQYLSKTVFFVATTDPACSSVFAPTLYDCSGTIIKKFGTTEKDRDELNKLRFEEVLYRCND